MLKVLLHRFFCDVARAPRTVPDCPEVSAPIPLAQGGKLLLQQARCSSLHPLDQIRECLRRRVLDVHMDVIFAHHTLQDAHIFSVADLHQHVSTSNFQVALQNMVTILRTPHDVRR